MWTWARSGVGVGVDLTSWRKGSRATRRVRLAISRVNLPRQGGVCKGRRWYLGGRIRHLGGEGVGYSFEVVCESVLK